MKFTLIGLVLAAAAGRETNTWRVQQGDVTRDLPDDDRRKLRCEDGGA